MNSARPQISSSRSLKWTAALLALSFAFVFSIGFWAVSKIISNAAHTREEGLFKQTQRTGHNLEKRYRTFLEDLSTIITLRLFQKFQNWDREDSETLTRIKRFYARHQDVIRRITVQSRDGKWISIHKTPENYFLINRNDKPGRQLFETEEPILVRDRSIFHYVEPVHDENGLVKMRIIVSTSLEDLFNSEIIGLFLGPESWMWLVNKQGQVLHQFTQADTRSQKESWTMPEMGTIREDIGNGFEGVTKTSMVASKTIPTVTAYYPVRLFDSRFGVVFSVSRSSISQGIINAALALGGLFSILVAVYSTIFIMTLKKHTEAAKAAEAANRSKSRFLANMSHEIRTPLNTIVGLAQIMDRDGDLPRQQLENVRLIMTASDNLLQIINDILDVSKVEAGHLNLVMEPVNLRDLTQELVDIHNVTAESKGVEVHRMFLDAPEWVLIDPVRIRQILINLLGNAVKFTSKGSITLRVSITQGTPAPNTMLVRFEVADTGVGIPEDKLKSIFRAFGQADDSVARKFGGTGLGLTIANGLVKLMGGSGISVSSSPEGSTFSFDVPMELCDAPDMKFGKKKKEETPAQETDHSDTTILVAEDTKMNRILLEKIFAGITLAGVDFVTNGQEAVDVMKKTPDKYNMILMDIQMPVMDGLTATKELRAHGISIPIIALTAHARQEDKNKCLEAGMTDFLAKPYKLEKLLEVMAEYAPRKG